MLQLRNETGTPDTYAVDFQDGRRRLNGAGPPAFSISVPDESYLEHILNAGAYSAAMAFVEGKLSVSGDIIGAIRLLRNRMRPNFFEKVRSVAARFSPAQLETYVQSRSRAARNIRFHYDLSNEFYTKFLDSRLIYSSALFKRPDWTLEQAQSAKLESICRKLDLQSGEEFLDVGCGWGGLMIYAAENYGVHASGCTLSKNQYRFATSAAAAHGLEDRIDIREDDYRNLPGRFRKIASVGMFEHVGRHRLGGYFRTIYNLLEDGGLFLNSGIVRPQSVKDDPETKFLLKEVFPGGELTYLSDIVREAENAGFEVLELDNIRTDYGRTCREWVERLRNSAAPCIALTGERSYRTWLLYLGASAVNFEAGQTDAYQILMAKRGASGTCGAAADRTREWIPDMKSQ